MTEKTLNDLLYETLKDIYYAERQIFRTLPKMAKGASSSELKQAFTHHREETEGQIQRLEQVFELISKPARGKTCEAIKGILEEGSETLETFEGSPALDAGLVADGQAVEHYEMARYGALISWANQLGLKDAATLLSQNLEEEKAADQLLTKLATGMVNKKAA
jgi:ferritin-like metal-binding protein YciE